MTPTNLSVVATLVAEAVGAVVMGALMLSFHRGHGKSYLVQWTAAWVCLAAADASTALWLSHALAGTAFESAIPRIVLPVVGGIAGFLFIGWVSFGVYEVAHRRHVRLLAHRRGLGALALLGFLSAFPLLLTRNTPALLFFTTFGLRSLLTTIIFTAAGVSLWRRRATRIHFGFVLLALTLIASAIKECWSFEQSLSWLAGGLPVQHSFYVSLGEVLLTSILGVAMVGCLLEDEREASSLATVEIEHLAYHDALTGLPNRPLFIDRLIVALAQSARSSHKLAVFFLDLDRFKDINDSLGHSVGDVLLKAVADRIRRCVRDGDTVARFGGDEFTLLIPRIDNVEDAGRIAQKILETLKIPFLIGDRELFATTSIGISIFPSDGTDPENLVRNADTAMYRAKEHGRDNYQLYAPAMNARALERLALENMMRRALAQQELAVYYQPLVDLQTNSICGVEALIRWEHPEMGLLSPAHFISVAELSGLIVPMGNWVLHTACLQTKQWQKKLGIPLRVAVNLSARQFQQADLFAQVQRTLDETELDPESLELEITESSAMHNAENTIHILNEIKMLGVKISMDDFGTGYSSLSYLKRFPIDTLKLDQSFVEDIPANLTDAAIATAVIVMAHSLKLSVVAEGVETQAQLDFFRNQGCDRIQGFLFAAPLPASEVEQHLLAKQTLKRTLEYGTTGNGAEVLA